MELLIQDNSLVLFQGDSITDAGRDPNDPQDLGRGYAMIAAGMFSAIHPEKNVSFLNRGIGGNRVQDLRERWDEDCIDLKPDCVSILIGINDTWRRYDKDDPTDAGAFEEAYLDILTRTRDELTCPLILCEPFLLPTPPDRLRWREDLDPKIDVVRKLAREFAAAYVPLDGIFAAISMRRDPSFWAPDGVHPSVAGHALIARSWLQAVGAI